jgi:acyl-CoA synthetase (AMP-forming)/AMP-acid ligase II
MVLGRRPNPPGPGRDEPDRDRVRLGPLPPATLTALQRHTSQDLCAFEIFGQTECIPCHRFWPGEWPELYGATAPQHNYVGIPSPILAATIMDPEGNDLYGRPGIAGEAVYRTPAVMSGYYRDEEATRHAFRFGWFHSGDSCAFDDNGLRIMLDRYKDIVKTGGENVSSLRCAPSTRATTPVPDHGSA